MSRKLAVASLVVVSTLPLPACATKAQTGAAVGAGIGALGGAIIGHNSGKGRNAGKGAAIGAAAGALGGYVVGHEMDKSDEDIRVKDAHEQYQNQPQK